MALASTVLTDASFRVHDDDVDAREYTYRSACTAGLLQRASALAGAPTRVTRESLRAFAQHHVASPIVDRALNENRFFPALRGDAGCLRRYARAPLSTKTGAVALERVPETFTNVFLIEPVLRPLDLHASRLAAGLVPLCVQALYCTSAMTASSMLTPLQAARFHVNATKLTTPSTTLVKRAAPYLHARGGFVEPAKPKPKRRSRDDEAEEVDDEEEEEEDEPAGESLGSDDDDSFDDEEESDDDEEEESDSDDTEENNATLASLHPLAAFDAFCRFYDTGPATLDDGRVIECNHTYIVNGLEHTCIAKHCHHGVADACAKFYKSTTTFVHAFESEPFDAPKVSAAMVASPAWPTNEEYNKPATEAACAAIRKNWALSYEPYTRDWPDDARAAAAAFLASELAFDGLLALLDTHGIRTHALRHSLADESAAHIRRMWQGYSEAGTGMHELLEHFFDAHACGKAAEKRTAIEALNRPELRQALRWHDEWLVPRGFVPYRVEPRIFDARVRICGSVDAIFHNPTTGEYIMVDWKRSKGVKRYGYERVLLSQADPTTGALFGWQQAAEKYRAKYFLTPIAFLNDDIYGHYLLQQLIYRTILERHTHIKLSAMYLVVCHPRQGENFDLIPLPLDGAGDAIERLFAARECALTTVESDDEF
jgi:hypothetical protein